MHATSIRQAGFRTTAYFGSVVKSTFDKYSVVYMIVCLGSLTLEDFLKNLAIRLRTFFFRPFTLMVNERQGGHIIIIQINQQLTSIRHD
jgi:hypothetical protein